MIKIKDQDSFLAEAHQSELIKAMRFPLICLVVIAHSAGAFPTPTVEWSLDGLNVFHYVAEMISRHFCGIGTCWFFVFSGFLLFYYLKDGEFSLEWVGAKWKKRIRSLLIPYLLWNLLAVLIIVFKNHFFQFLSLSVQNEELEMVRKGPLYWFFTGPADFPLWFLRDLMLLTLLAPLMYLFFKRFRWLSLSLLVLVYLSPLEPFIPTMRSVFFFFIGVWLGTHRINLLTLCQRVKIPATIIALILLPIAASQIGRPPHTFLLRLFYPFGMVVFMNICNKIIENKKKRDRLCTLSNSVFFIYAAHEIYILGWSKGICLRLFGTSLAGIWLRYLLVPVMVVMICLTLYRILDKLMPRALSFACGGRSKK